MIFNTSILSASSTGLLPAYQQQPKAMIAGLSAFGLHALQLNIAQPDFRPRSLDSRARKDLKAQLSRHSLMLSGLDLMIPAEHWTSPEHQDKAINAAIAGIQMAADLDRVALCLALPVNDLPEDIEAELLNGMDGLGVPLYVHAEDRPEHLLKWLNKHQHPQLGAAIDPAALLANQQTPEQIAAQFGSQLRLARWDDFDSKRVTTGTGRCLVGEGQLDVEAYRITLDLQSDLRMQVIETRELADPLLALRQAIHHAQAGPT